MIKFIKSFSRFTLKAPFSENKRNIKRKTLINFPPSTCALKSDLSHLLSPPKDSWVIQMTLSSPLLNYDFIPSKSNY